MAVRNIELNVSGTVNKLYSEMDNSDSYHTTGLQEKEWVNTSFHRDRRMWISLFLFSFLFFY